MKSSMNQQSGFTLIELIMVIVILGVLAATALPKFQSLDGDARTAVVKGAAGEYRTAAVISYGKAKAQVTKADIDAAITLDANIVETGTCATGITFTYGTTTSVETIPAAQLTDLCNG